METPDTRLPTETAHTHPATTVPRCQRCILPENYPGITLDDEGVCTHCRNYTPKPVKGADVLWAAIRKRTGTTYDVLVPVSGGRDSTFVLCQAVEQFGKRVFALHFDNDFQVPQARQNFLNAVQKFGIEYRIVQSKYHFPRKMVRHAVKAALPFGLFDLTTNCCVACTYGFRAASYRAAVELGIPNILWGDSEPEAITFSYRQSRLKFFFSSRWYHYVLFILYTLLFQLELWIPKSRFFHLSAPTTSRTGVRDLHFFDYAEWDRGKIKDVITREVGWSVPPGTVSTWRFDCTIHPVVNYCFKQTYGFSKDFDGFANMIRIGKMEREEALQQEEHLGYMDETLKTILRDDLKLSQRELTQYFGIGASPPA